MAAAAVAVALALDLVVAEPPTAAHPVAWFGRLVGTVDREWASPRLVGIAAAVGLPLVAAAVVGGTVTLVGSAWPLGGVLAAGLALFVTTSFRRLLTAVRDVNAATEDAPDAARERLRALAGRDATSLSPGQVRSAAVESAAENLADGFVAPLAAFTILAPASPSLAAAAAAGVKAVNTMDSMLGYRDRPVGWASARLDDVVMAVPARTSAVLLAVAAGSTGAIGRARSWLGSVPSPNSGWPMGVLAAALSVRLEKPGVYALNPGESLPTAADGRRAVRTVAVAGLLAYALAAGAVLAWEVAVS